MEAAAQAADGGKYELHSSTIDLHKHSKAFIELLSN